MKLRFKLTVLGLVVLSFAFGFWTSLGVRDGQVDTVQRAEAESGGNGIAGRLRWGSDCWFPEQVQPAVSVVERRTITRNHPLAAASRPAERIGRLLDAIERVESGGNCKAIGDNGRARGPYQIHRVYWTDSGRSAASYRAGSMNRAASRQAVLDYWKRYAPAALAAGDMETLARVHNGGPRGASKAATRSYWRRVAAQVNK